jgi:hypothetical protein
MSSISAGTATGTALVSTGDTTGALQLQVNGTTPSVTLAANGSIGVGSTPGYGTSGQVLTSAGTGSAPTWATVSSGVTLVTSTTATAASSVIFTNLSTTYGLYLLEFDSTFISTTSEGLYFTVSSDNGATYYASGYRNNGTYSSAATTSTANQNLTSFNLVTSWIAGTGSTLATSASGSIWMYNPAASGKTFNAQHLAASNQSDGIQVIVNLGFQLDTSGSAVNAVKIFGGGGSTITGKFRLYGYAA